MSLFTESAFEFLSLTVCFFDEGLTVTVPSRLAINIEAHVLIPSPAVDHAVYRLLRRG
jgi:hypothetical protein